MRPSLTAPHSCLPFSVCGFCFQVSTLLAGDAASAVLIERCADLATNPPAADWDGSEVLKDKTFTEAKAKGQTVRYICCRWLLFPLACVVVAAAAAGVVAHGSFSCRSCSPHCSCLLFSLRNLQDEGQREEGTDTDLIMKRKMSQVGVGNIGAAAAASASASAL